MTRRRVPGPAVLPVGQAAAPVLLAVLLAGLLTGCSHGRPLPSPPAAQAVVPTAPTAAPPAATATTPTLPTAPATPTTDDGAPPEVVLQGDGLGLLSPDASVQVLAFGAASGSQVQQTVEDVLGPATVSMLPQCPQGPRTAVVADGFTVLLDGDRFVGWTDTGAPDRSLTTSDGIGTGSRLEDLQSALPDTQVVPAPPGATWTTGSGLSGRLDGVDPGARVTAVSAGQTCG